MKKSDTNLQPEISVTKADKQPLLIALAMGLVVAGVLIGYAWQHQKVSSLDKQLMAAQSAVAATAVRSSASTPGNVNLLTASAFTSSFYTNYMSATRNGGSGDTVVKNDGTANLVFYNSYYQHGFDPIVCAQALPDSIKASGLSTSNGVATVSLKETFATSSQTVTVRVVDQGSLKIDSVTCPGSSGNLPLASGEN